MADLPAGLVPAQAPLTQPPPVPAGLTPNNPKLPAGLTPAAPPPPTPGASDYDRLFTKSGIQYGVDPGILKAISAKETVLGKGAFYDPKTGHSTMPGNLGVSIMQLDRSHFPAGPAGDAEWKSYALNQPAAVDRVAKDFSAMLKANGGDVRAAMKAYNGAGPDAEKYADAVMHIWHSLDPNYKDPKTTAVLAQAKPALPAAVASAAPTAPTGLNPFKGFNLQAAAVDSVHGAMDIVHKFGVYEGQVNKNTQERLVPVLKGAGRILAAPVLTVGDLLVKLDDMIYNAGKGPVQRGLDILGAGARAGTAIDEQYRKHQAEFVNTPKPTITYGKNYRGDTLSIQHPNVGPADTARFLVSPPVAAFQTAMDYVLHPDNFGSIVHAIATPEDGQKLSNLITTHVHDTLGLPPPEQMTAWTRIFEQTVQQAKDDPLSYVSFSAITRMMGAGAKIWSDAKVGSEIAKTLGATPGFELLKSQAAVAASPGGFLHTAYNTSRVIMDKLFSIRTDLDPIATGPNMRPGFVGQRAKLARMGAELHGSNESKSLAVEHQDLLKKNAEQLKSARIGDQTAPDMVNADHKMMYVYGTQADRENAIMCGYKPSMDEKLVLPHEFIDFSTAGSPTGAHFGSSEVLKDVGGEKKTTDKVWASDKGYVKDPSFLSDPTGGLHPNAFADTGMTADEISKLSSMSQYDMYAQRLAAMRDVVARKMTAQTTAKLYLSEPQIIDQAPLGGYKFIQAAREAEISDPAAYKVMEKQLADWFEKNFNSRQPEFRIPSVRVKLPGGEAKTWEPSDALHYVANLWKGSIVGNPAPHAFRNVGIVTMLRGGVGVAAEGLRRMIKGIPDKSLEEGHTYGWAGHFWRETPEIFGKLGEGVNTYLRAMSKVMDRFETSYRSAYWDHINETLGPAKSEVDKFARAATVANDLGGYENTNNVVKVLQGIGGVYDAYRFATAPGAVGKALVTNTNRVTLPMRAEQAASGLLPGNQASAQAGGDPRDYSEHLRVMGPLDETFRAVLDLPKYAGSPASIGSTLHSAGEQMFNPTANDYPKNPVQQGDVVLNDLLGITPGGGAAQTVLQSVDPSASGYPDNSGLGWLQQLVIRIPGGYVETETKGMRKHQSQVNKRYQKAEDAQMPSFLEP